MHHGIHVHWSAFDNYNNMIILQDAGFFILCMVLIMLAVPLVFNALFPYNETTEQINEIATNYYSHKQLKNQNEND